MPVPIDANLVAAAFSGSNLLGSNLLASNLPASFNASMLATAFSGTNLLAPNLPETNGGRTPSFDVEVPVSEVEAANVSLPSNVDLPADLHQYVVNVWVSGGQTNYSLAFQTGTNFQATLDALVLGNWQIDLCRIIEPASLGTLPREYPTPASAVPRATVDLGLTSEAQHAN